MTRPILSLSSASSPGTDSVNKSKAIGWAKPIQTCFADIVCGATDHRDRLDSEISSVLTENWPISRLDSVLRAILRAGAYELMHRRDVPPRVSLSEYTAIAYAFFTGKEPGLANGVLNHLARTFRDNDL